MKEYGRNSILGLSNMNGQLRIVYGEVTIYIGINEMCSRMQECDANKQAILNKYLK